MNLSLKTYLLLITIVILVFSILFGGYTFRQIENAQVTLSQWKRDSAEKEINSAIRKVTEIAKIQTKKFASWDEVSQQLHKPAYYPYWRDQRMMSANFLPQNAISANLYDINGQSLLSSNDFAFPNQFNPKNIPPPYIFKKKDKTTQLIYIEPVYSKVENYTLGFVATSLPLIQLLANQSYQHIQAHSIQIYSKKEKTNIDNIFNLIKYNLEEDISSNIIKVILNNTMKAILLAIIFIIFVLYLLLNNGVRKPLEKLIQHINDLRKNTHVFHSTKYIKQLPIKELNKVIEALNTYSKELETVHINLDIKNKELETLAYTDPLTQMKNRRAFNDHWQNIISISQSTRMDITMLLFDVNHFKAINDSYGHKVGDELLITVSSLVANELRKGDYLYRLGGDEFGTAIINCGTNSAYDVAKRCLKNIREFNFKSLGIMENIRISIGISSANTNYISELDNLVWQADAAVYLAKQPSNDNIMIYTSENNDSSKSLFSNHIYAAVFDAVEDTKGILMFYQPIIDLNDNSVSYYESLVRIQLNDEIIPPNQIFPIVTARQLDIDMDKAIVNTIIKDLNKDVIPQNTGLSINLSGASVVSNDLISWTKPLIQYLNNYKIVFEVTETSLITQLSRASTNLAKLKSMGFEIALDDFGSGYSSLRYLGNMPVDIVKFDISLIRELNQKKKSSLIYNLCNMINEIGYILVAEGIETVDTHNQIIQAGFNYGQGYLYGKPTDKNLITEVSFS